MSKRSLICRDIELIEQYQGELLDFIRSEYDLKTAIEALNVGSTFGDSWSVIKDRFRYLKRFFGCFATAVLGTIQAEEDFSLTK